MGADNDELLTMIKQAFKKPRNFALAYKGKNVAMLVSKKPIKSNQIKALRAEVGGTNAVSGVCLKEGPEFVFRSLDGVPESLKTVVKEYVKEQASLAIKPSFVQVASLDAVDEDDEDDASSSSESGKAAAVQKKNEAAKKKEDARLKKLQKSVQEDFKAALKESGPAIVGDPATKKLAGEVKKALEKKRYDDAAAAMAALKDALA